MFNTELLLFPTVLTFEDLHDGHLTVGISVRFQFSWKSGDIHITSIKDCSMPFNCVV